MNAKWISVEDELPKKLQKILFIWIMFDSLGNACARNTSMGYLCKAGWNIYLPYHSYGLNDDACKVTHWMESPEMPSFDFKKSFKCLERFEFYYLDENKKAIPCSSNEWSSYFERNNRNLGDDDIEGKRVSTVFLGLNHNYHPTCTIPLIFETMVFNENHSDIYCERYSSWEEAEAGHQKAIQWVKEGCKDDEED